MKIAHLILCHTNPTQVERLIRRLRHEDAWFFIHLDNKTDITGFMPLRDTLLNVAFIKERTTVHWGGYSVVEATLNSFAEILSSGKTFDYINLLSGQDYPLKSTTDIHRFFGNNPGKAFMHALPAGENKDALPGITRYHLPYRNFPGKYRIEKLLNAILPKRKAPGTFTPVGSSQWFTITLEHAAYIVGHLPADKPLVHFFKYSWAPDEMIFQTVLYNSVYKKDIVNDNLRYTDWSAGGASPKLLTMADAGAITASGKLFARKFNMATGYKILDYLDENIK